MVFHWSLNDSKSPQVSRTLLSILAVLNNIVVWMVSTRLPTSKSSSPFSNPLVTVPNALITIGIIVTFMFQSFFQFPSKVQVLILFQILSVLFCGQPGQQSRQFCNFSSFCWLLLGLVFWPRLGDLCVCQSPIEVYVCYFLGRVPGCADHYYYYYYYCCCCFTLFGVFHTSVSWWFSTGVWVTISLHKSPGLF